MAILAKSTAHNRAFLMVQTSDHITGLTGATPACNISKNGAAFGAAGGAVTEIANGWYQVALNTTDTGTAGDLAFHITAASGDPTDFVDQVVDPAVVTIGTNQVQVNGVSTSPVTTVAANIGTTQPVNFTGTAASALVKSDVTDIAASAVATGSAQIGVNVVNWGGVSAGSLPANFGTLSVNASGQISVQSNIKKNTTQNGFMFIMTDSTTHAPKTGVVVTAQRAIDGGAYASCANSASEISNGMYSINLAAADVNGNHIMLRFTGTASDDLNIELITEP